MPEDQTPSPNTPSAPTVQAMDIMQPTKPTDSPVESVSSVANEPTESPKPVEVTEDTTVQQDPVPAPQDTTQVPEANAPVVPTQTEDHVSGVQAESHHAHTPIAAIAIAVVVAMILAGLVIFGYMKSKDNQTASNPSSGTTTQTVAEKPQASVTDVDNADKDIDDSLQKIDDTKDFTSSDLSDTTLGL